VQLDLWDPGAALRAIARGVLHSRQPFGRRWFVLWPAIPEPAIYDAYVPRAARAA